MLRPELNAESPAASAIPEYLPYGEEDILRCFGPRELEKARPYARDGSVTNLHVIESTSLVSVDADVKGTRSEPYRAQAVVEAPDGEVELSGTCTCPVGFDCKHVVATLLAAHERSCASRNVAAVGSSARKEIAFWLQRIDAALQPSSSVSSERVLYFLDGARTYGDPLPLRLGVARVRKDGGWGQVRNYSFDTLASSAAGFVEDVDRAIAAQIVALRRVHNMRGPEFRELFDRAMRGILASGRAYLESPKEAPLRLGEPRAAHLDWSLDLDGTQKAFIQSDVPGTTVLSSAVPWYVDRASGQSGPLAIDMPLIVLHELLFAPRVTLDDAPGVRDALMERFGETPAIRPPVLEIAQVVQHVDPVPVLTFKTRTTYQPQYYRARSAAIQPLLTIDSTLHFDYAGTLLPYHDRREDLREVRDKTIAIVPRDRAAESVALERLREAMPDERATALEWARFQREIAPALEREGWQVRWEGKSLAAILDLGAPNAKWHASLRSRGEWFDADLGVDVDGKSMPLLPLLLELAPQLRNADLTGEFAYVEGAGRVVVLPAERVRRVLETFAEIYERPDMTSGGKLILNRVAALAAAQALPEMQPEDEQTRALCALAKRFATFSGIADVPVPSELRASLRPYQHEGFRWLQFLREYGCGGILADDMGLGKTIQTIAHLLHEKASAEMPSLLIVPTSLVPNWAAELERFAPSLRVLIWHGSQRKSRAAKFEDSDVVITTYALLSRDTALAKRKWRVAVFDEAQALKNPQSKVAQSAARVHAEQRICLTGTPMENHLGELWAVMNLVMPHALYDQRRFNELFRNPIEKRGDPQRREALAKRIRPFLLRRTKADVDLQLPPKTEIIERIELASGQRDLYETLRAGMHERVRKEIRRLGIARSRITVLDALLKLRQACCDPRLVKLESAADVHESAKLDWLIDMLEQLAQEGRRTLVFSQFTSMIDLIKPRLNASGVHYAEIVGSTTDRATPVRRFQAGEVPVFLISLKAGGTGLNLTAADTVIHYDPWWNPAVERQATDRAHRIGQEKPVFVYKAIAAGTVEEKILDLQARKAELADALFGAADSASLDLQAEDIDALFS